MSTDKQPVPSNKKLTISDLRDRLSGKTGKELWRSLDEIADTEEFRALLQDEFPREARTWEFDMDRRQFLKFAVVSIGLAGLSGCRFLPQEKIVPFVKAPEDMLPGKPVYYATTFVHRGYGVGVIAKSVEGRPIKLEGNPKHPASLGKADAITQASIYDLYDPDRSSDILFQGEPAIWDAFVAAMREVVARYKMSGGRGLRILTETVTSPSVIAIMQRLQELYPEMVWHQYEPLNNDNLLEGSFLAFGSAYDTVYRLDKAVRVLSLDADFLHSMPGSIRYAADFASMRRVRRGTTEINRLYVVEGSVSVTGANADHRLGVRPSEVELFARALAARLGIRVPGALLPASVPAKWVEVLVHDLTAHRGRCLVIAGEGQPPAVHALAHAMNAVLGNVGSTLYYIPPVARVPAAGTQAASLRELARDLHAGRVHTLFVLGANPVYHGPSDLAFADAMNEAKVRIHLGLHFDETARLCDWHVPASHYLEQWGDSRAFDGTVSITQPLIEPLYRSRSLPEVLALLAGDPRRGYDILTDYWRAQRPGADFDSVWDKIKQQGFIEGSESRPVTPNLKQMELPPPNTGRPGIELCFRPDPTIEDGRYANNAWLQELPKPLTTVVWDNPLLLAPALAERFGLDTGEVVRLKLDGRELEAVAWVQPGHPDNSITAYLGGGRSDVGKMASGVGFDTNELRTSEGAWFRSGLELIKTGKRYRLAATQNHHLLHGHYSQHGRELLRVRTLSEFIELATNPKEHDSKHKELTLYEPPESFRNYQGHKWGMSIDLSACIGCNACVVACQAENNIPVVGKDQVARGREMHWIRIDRYFEKGLDEPETHFQPVPCMQCEKAPCEPVCPVGATLHSHDGLNQMVYNRCIGTRYCSNNCPYKVRRFNFYKYSAGQPHNAPGNYDYPTLQMLANPDVTIRGRGVMEKCTYCVQRINAARVTAKKERRPIRDGEIVPACMQTCPTGAISFGDVGDPESEVSLRKSEPHDYGLLTELNTVPRTTYLMRIKNPNPEIVETSA